MSLFLTFLVSVWAAVYSGSVTIALWRRRNVRGAVGTALLTVITLTVPPLVNLINQNR